MGSKVRWLALVAVILICGSCSIKKHISETRDREETSIENKRVSTSIVSIDSIMSNLEIEADSIVIVAAIDSAGSVSSLVRKIYRPNARSSISKRESYSESVSDSSKICTSESESVSVMKDTDTEVEKVFDMTTIICVAIASVVLLGVFIAFLYMRLRR